MTKLLALLVFIIISDTADCQNNTDLSKNKICIDKVNSNLLLNKWYDFAPPYYVEQTETTSFYVSNHTQLHDSLAYSSTITFLGDGTFKKIAKRFDKKDMDDLKIDGTWSVDIVNRTLKMKSSNSKCTLVYTILDLTNTNLLLKIEYGKGVICP